MPWCGFAYLLLVGVTGCFLLCVAGKLCIKLLIVCTVAGFPIVLLDFGCWSLLRCVAVCVMRCTCWVLPLLLVLLVVFMQDFVVNLTFSVLFDCYLLVLYCLPSLLSGICCFTYG